MELLAARFKDFSLYVFTKYFTTSCLGIIKTSFYVYKCITFPLNKPKIRSITADFYKEIISDFFSSPWLQVNYYVAKIGGHRSQWFYIKEIKPLRPMPPNFCHIITSVQVIFVVDTVVTYYCVYYDYYVLEQTLVHV